MNSSVFVHGLQIMQLFFIIELLSFLHEPLTPPQCLVIFFFEASNFYVILDTNAVSDCFVHKHNVHYIICHVTSPNHFLPIVLQIASVEYIKVIFF